MSWYWHRGAFQGPGTAVPWSDSSAEVMGHYLPLRHVRRAASAVIANGVSNDRVRARVWDTAHRTGHS